MDPVRWMFTVVLNCACFSTHLLPGASCPDGVCPEGLICAPLTHTCELAASATDAGDDSPPDSAAATAKLVQQVHASSSSAATLSITLAPPAVGDVLVMIGGGPHAGLTSVSGGGATWTRAAQSTMHANIEIWIGVTDGSSSTVTIMLSGSTIEMMMSVSEWSGLSTLDIAQAAAGTSSPGSAGSITTTHAHDLLLFVVADGAPTTFGTPLPGSWTALDPIVLATVAQGEWFSTVETTGTFIPSATETGHAWDAAIAALRIGP
jgi:hypothetical protein